MLEQTAYSIQPTYIIKHTTHNIQPGYIETYAIHNFPTKYQEAKVCAVFVGINPSSSTTEKHRTHPQPTSLQPSSAAGGREAIRIRIEMMTSPPPPTPTPTPNS